MAISSRAGLGGDIPQMNRMPEGRGSKPLFHSERDKSLIIDKTVLPGFGVLRIGTMMAKSVTTGFLVPYITTDHKDANIGRSYLISDAINTESTCRIRLEDSYKMAVGESLILVNDNSGSPVYHDGGAIVSIDRTSSPVFATVTFTNALAVATFTVARSANCYIKSGTSGKYSTCTYVLDKDLDVGAGPYAKGGLTSVVLSNAILYLASLINYDAAAKNDLGAIEDGRFLILK